MTNGILQTKLAGRTDASKNYQHNRKKSKCGASKVNSYTTLGSPAILFLGWLLCALQREAK